MELYVHTVSNQNHHFVHGFVIVTVKDIFMKIAKNKCLLDQREIIMKLNNLIGFVMIVKIIRQYAFVARLKVKY